MSGCRNGPSFIDTIWKGSYICRTCACQRARRCRGSRGSPFQDEGSCLSGWRVFREQFWEETSGPSHVDSIGMPEPVEHQRFFVRNAHRDEREKREQVRHTDRPIGRQEKESRRMRGVIRRACPLAAKSRV